MPRFRRTLSLVVGAILLLITAGVFERRLCVGGACFLSPDEHAGEAHKLELRSPKGSEIAVKGIDEIRNLAGKARKAADRDRKRHDESRRKKKAAKKEPDAPPPPMPGPLKAPSNLIEIEGAKPEKKDRAQKKSSGKPAPSSKPLSTDMMRSHDLQAPFVDRKLDSESEIPKNRPNACIVTLARNSDLPGVMHSIEQFEAMSNSRFRYPYVFLNDKPFTSDFVEAVRDTIASSRGVDPTDVRDGIDIEFGLVPVEHWSYPYWINLTIADQWRQDMQRSGVIYGGSESYRHMCRWPFLNSSARFEPPN